MDELRGPTIQIVLHVKEGLGFGFLKSPVVVSGSLNGYILETDPTVPTHAPSFDAELVWEADKRRFRSLRVQNVPVKIEVYTTSTQGKKDKVGYLLLSLLGAQPCPTNKMVEVKHTWHKLLGVKSEGKCCHPQLLMSLSVEDRVNTLTPRNDLRMFQSNETAYPAPTNTTSGPVKLTLNEYLQESKSSVSHPDIEPRLLSEEGLIQIGDGQDLFVLSIFIGTIENIDLLLPFDSNDKDPECYITYTIFTHTIKTESVRPRAGRVSVHERSSVRVRGALRAVSRALAARPRLNAALCAPHTLGVCSMDLTKLVPTDDIQTFTQNFCTNNVLTVHERCFFVRADDVTIKDTRRPYVDVELSLKYAGLCNLEKPLLTARSATQLKMDKDEDTQVMGFKSESCTNVEQGVGGVAYTKIGSNTARSKKPSGDTDQTKEIAKLIRKMYESFTLSQEKLLTQLKPVTSDVQVQCEHDNDEQTDTMEREPVKLETSKSDTCIKNNEKYMIEKMLSPSDRSELMKKYVDELEDWKERQQQLFNCQLKRKEEHHLSLLSSSWGGRRSELEGRLSRGVERCGRLAGDLAAAAEDLRRRGHRNSQRERELLDAKKGLEEHYTSKYQELRVASQKMEDDMNHRLKLKDMQVEELQHKAQLLEKQNDVLKNNLKNSEKDIENKYSGLTKDQTASLIQELRNLEEKLDSAVQSKSFFKEQWGRAVRELHCLKMSTRRQMLHTLRTEKRRLGDMSLNPIEDEELMNSESQVDINKLKDDFYVDILANTPALESHSIMSKDGLELYDDLKNLPLPKHNSSDRLGTLITQRDELIQHQAPDEQRLTQLNHEIRNMLLNCAS